MEAWKEEMEENMQKMKAGMNASAGKTRVIYLSGDEGAQNIRVKSSGGEKKHIRIHKKILIRIPKEARLHLQTRYGAVKLPGNLTDIRADMSYTRLFADQVNGSETFIETSYAPVAVKNWAHGKLTVNYSDSVVLDRVGAIDLVMNTSDVRVKEVYRKGSVHGSFGSLQIDRIARDIDTLQLRLNNTDAVVRLPESDFVFLVSGENSEVDLPGRLEVSTSVKGSRTDIKGYYKKEDSGRSISVKARYSDLKFH
ncbi:hypothetical protein DN748_06695 [Sinomicrobium soli]|nr:hypothetical protein DN748_06695 [Sinomicrobium sp. N-1-3-6]